VAPEVVAVVAEEDNELTQSFAIRERLGLIFLKKV
jgi:hypothetical protein